MMNSDGLKGIVKFHFKIPSFDSAKNYYVRTFPSPSYDGPIMFNISFSRVLLFFLLKRRVYQ